MRILDRAVYVGPSLYAHFPVIRLELDLTDRFVNLAQEGYLVAKYVPYGPVRQVMPYLLRRAEENTSVAGQSSRELTLIQPSS